MVKITLSWKEIDHFDWVAHSRYSSLAVQSRPDVIWRSVAKWGNTIWFRRCCQDATWFGATRSHICWGLLIATCRLQTMVAGAAVIKGTILVGSGTGGARTVSNSSNDFCFLKVLSFWCFWVIPTHETESKELESTLYWRVILLPNRRYREVGCKTERIESSLVYCRHAVRFFWSLTERS